MTRRLRPWLAAVTLLLTGCTGVPTSSSPQVIESHVKVGGQSEKVIGPNPGASEREIVSKFLNLSTANPRKQHASARSFLTPAAQNRWTDDSVTIITDEVIGTYDRKSRTVNVYGRKIGTVDGDGTFHPDPNNDGSGPRVAYKFTLKDVNGQYRIDQLPRGLLLTQSQFDNAYRQYPLYFFDDNNQYLIADPRYSDIATLDTSSDHADLANWLMDQLVAGPREELKDAVTADTLPTQSVGSRINVQIGVPTRVEIPGSSHLDADGLNHLAAQVSQTLDAALSGTNVEITDGGRPVRIPYVGQPQFVTGNFADRVAAQSSGADDVYYLSGGRIYDETGKPLAGVLGRDSHYYLTSVALSRPDSTLLVAGVTGSGTAQQLLVGNTDTGLRAAGLRGPLTRPSFAARQREVWMGDGPRLVRVVVSATGVKQRVISLPVAGMQAGQGISAVRVSPDGVRIAFVQMSRGQIGGQLMVGSIVRGSGSVRVDGLTRISPDQSAISDVAWLGSLRLFAIGRVGAPVPPGGTTSPDWRSFDTRVDGSEWSSRVVSLDSQPDQVTATADNVPWLSAGGYVWKQDPSGVWGAPIGGQTPGTSPIYQE